MTYLTTACSHNIAFEQHNKLLFDVTIKAQHKLAAMKLSYSFFLKPIIYKCFTAATQSESAMMSCDGRRVHRVGHYVGSLSLWLVVVPFWNQ